MWLQYPIAYMFVWFARCKPQELAEKICVCLGIENGIVAGIYHLIEAHACTNSGSQEKNRIKKYHLDI